MPMTTHEAARRTLSTLIRAFHRDEIEEGKFRALVYSFNCLLAYFKFSADIEIEERLDRIEEALGARR